MGYLEDFVWRSRPLFLIIDEAPRLKDRIDFEQVLQGRPLGRQASDPFAGGRRDPGARNVIVRSLR